MKINEACKELIIKILEEFGGMNTSISGMVDVQPIEPVGGVSFKKEKRGKSKKAVYNFPYRKNRSKVQ